MGNLSTHRQIEEEIMREVDALRRDDGEISMYVEVGNWLTDLSQLSDPPAHIASTIAIWPRPVSSGAMNATRHAAW